MAVDALQSILLLVSSVNASPKRVRKSCVSVSASNASSSRMKSMGTDGR